MSAAAKQKTAPNSIFIMDMTANGILKVSAKNVKKGKTMETGRKFIGLLIAFALLIAGLVVVNKLKMTVEWFNVYAKWIVVALGIFTGGNGAITISSLLSHNAEEKK